LSPLGASATDAGQSRTHTRRTRALSTLAVSALLVGTVGAGAVSAQSPAASGAPAVAGDASFFGWDVADLTAGLGKGFETARQSTEMSAGSAG